MEYKIAFTEQSSLDVINTIKKFKLSPIFRGLNTIEYNYW